MKEFVFICLAIVYENYESYNALNYCIHQRCPIKTKTNLMAKEEKEKQQQQVIRPLPTGIMECVPGLPAAILSMKLS